MIDVGKWELDDLAVVKNIRMEKAETALNKAKAELIRQEEILEKRKQILKQTEQHIIDQHNILNQEKRKGTTQELVKSRNRFIGKLIDIKHEKEKDVNNQKKNVRDAEQNVKKANIAYKNAYMEVQKLKEFRKDWAKDREEYLDELEEEEMDEVGTLMFEHRRRAIRGE